MPFEILKFNINFIIAPTAGVAGIWVEIYGSTISSQLRNFGQSFLRILLHEINRFRRVSRFPLSGGISYIAERWFEIVSLLAFNLIPVSHNAHTRVAEFPPEKADGLFWTTLREIVV